MAETQNPAELQAAEFYSNSVRIASSPFEIAVQHQLVDAPGNVKGAVNIRMSPQTAWTFARALAKQIEAYEKEFGPVQLPAEVRKSLGG